MKKPTPIPPVGVSVNDTIGKRIVRWLLSAIASAIFAVLMLVLIVEWAAGCGEVYIDSKGVAHEYKCIFLNR